MGILSADLHLPAARSLKAKRKELQRVKARLAKGHGCAVAEVDHHDLWQRARLTIAIAGRDAGEVVDRLDAVRARLAGDEAFELLDDVHACLRADEIIDGRAFPAE